MTYFIGLDLGLGVGPYILGELHQFLNFPQLYFVSGLLPIVCAVLYKLFYRPKYADNKIIEISTESKGA